MQHQQPRQLLLGCLHRRRLRLAAEWGLLELLAALHALPPCLLFPATVIWLLAAPPRLRLLLFYHPQLLCLQ